MSENYFTKYWWTKPSAAFYFSKSLLIYFVQLAISYKTNGKTHRTPNTGIIIDVDGKLLWLSAGHVIESIIALNKSKSIFDIRWLDRYESKGAETLPFIHKEIQFYSSEHHNCDYGAILLSDYESIHFKNNKNIKPLVMRFSSKSDFTYNPEGYILAGFPWENVTIDSIPVSTGKDKIILKSDLICLPIEKIPWYDIPVHDGIWDDRDAFYGQILPYTNNEYKQPNKLEGMSGGPIFSFYRKNHKLNIKLEGIFDSYLQKSRFVRAEPTDRLLANLHSWINSLTNNNIK